MVNHCCVPGCTSDSRGSTDISFHNFPTNEELKKTWIVKIRRDPGKLFSITKSTRVCSLHFCNDDYFGTAGDVLRRKLKPGVVPTVFSWNTATRTRRQLTRDVQSSSIVQSAEGSSEHSYSVKDFVASSSSAGMQSLTEHAYSSGLCKAGPSRLDAEFESSEDEPLLPYPHESTEESQVESSPPSPTKDSLRKQYLHLLKTRSEEKFCLWRFIESDKDIHFYTGFENFLALKCFYEFLFPASSYLYYVGTDNTSQGKKPFELKPHGPGRLLSPIEELFLTLVRLRRGWQEKELGDVFGLSTSSVSKITNTWILFLADRLSYLPIWPTREHVKETMPAVFKEHYSSTRVIVDCTEMKIEQPSSAFPQQETFSNYKQTNTAKCLLGIAPSGQITFISPVYAGRCSDKKIFKHCGIIDKLENGDSVMADRGFDIEEELKECGVGLNIPPFSRGKEQFSEQELQETRKIAAARVHVERVIGQIKNFKILCNVIPITLAPMIDKIWTVCAHLTNFTYNLLKEKN